MRSLPIALFLCFVATAAIHGQSTDTFTVLQYNLLNYAASDNPSSYKNPRLQTIINYCQPDIFGANEIANGSQNSQNILNNVLGSAWEKGSYVNSNNSIQTNMLFWKKDKFGLISQESIANQVRDIIAFKLYYKDVALAQTHDTAYLTVIVAHLKAGDNTGDSLDRFTETSIVANYLENYFGSPGNYLFMGDLNVYSSYEACYDRLVNSPNTSSRFYDPNDKPGYWNGNSIFARYHSQSTRKVYLSDGGATGGLDDRFDQILVSGPIKDNTEKIGYQPSSYHIVGQDGNHYNKGLLDNPVNTSVPQPVLQALYEMSDHLPVTAKFTVKRSGGISSITETQPADEWFLVTNPVSGRQLRIDFTGRQRVNASLKVNLYSLTGQSLFKADWNPGNNTHFAQTIPVLSQGLYLLQITGAESKMASRRLLYIR